MSQITLEAIAKRLTALEAAVNEIRQYQPKGACAKDWRRVIGMFAGDEVMKQIDEAGRQIREAEQPETTE